MIYNKPQIYEALNAILPTYYEQIVDANTETPCITYMESGNYDDTVTCETMGYSNQTYTIFDKSTMTYRSPGIYAQH